MSDQPTNPNPFAQGDPSPKDPPPFSARVPEKVKAVYCTAEVIHDSPKEFIIDFMQGLNRPFQVVARVVITPATMAEFISAYDKNVENYTKNFGTPPAPPKPPDERRPTIEEIYEHYKLGDDQHSGVYANTVLMGHTPTEFFFDFITSFYPTPAVSRGNFARAAGASVFGDSEKQFAAVSAEVFAEAPAGHRHRTADLIRHESNSSQGAGNHCGTDGDRMHPVGRMCDLAKARECRRPGGAAGAALSVEPCDAAGIGRGRQADGPDAGTGESDDGALRADLGVAERRSQRHATPAVGSPCHDNHDRARHSAGAGDQHAPSTQPIEMLCLSGGGQYGAFGAGFLKGWSGVPGPASRPSFDIVTGISTGSLISTFAFLGKDYDDQLEHAYLDAAQGEPVFAPRFLYGLLLSDSIATRKGLEHRVKKMFTPELLRSVAEATDGGRRSLLVGTVNLDSGKMTYWNLSRIAEIGVKLETTHPGALKQATELYRTILLAGTAIPGALPPVLIDRDRYREFFEDDPSCDAIVYPDWTQHATLHCDGGARENVFAVQLASSLVLNRPNRNGGYAPVNVYLIGNGTIHDGPQVTKQMVLPIGERAVSVLLTEAMRGSIATIALLGRSEKWNVQLAYLSSTECDHLLPAGGGIVDAFNDPFMECIMRVGETRGSSTDPNVRWNHFSELGLPDPHQAE